MKKFTFSFKKISLVTSGFLVLFLSGINLYSQVLIPFSGSNSIACGTNTTLCTHAGCGNTYSANANGYTVLNGGGTAVITISGSYNTESCCDYVRIYAGSGTGGTILATYQGNNTFTYTGGVGQTLTVQFYADYSVQYTGLNSTVSFSGSCSSDHCFTCPTYDFGPYTPSTTAATHSSNTTTAAGCRLYAFNVTTGIEYVFSTCSNGGNYTGDSRMILYNSACTELVNIDDFCGVGPQITWIATYSGLAYVRLAHYGMGAAVSWTLAYWRGALPGENCSNAQDLASLPNPFSGTTVGYADDISACHTGFPDRIFYIDVPNGYILDIWEPSNGYDEWEYVGYGATCPGTQIQCWDNDGLVHTIWTNNTGATQRVWWIQDAYSGSGTFNLQWTLTSPCTISCPSGGVAEGEACGADVNGGCNMATPAFRNVNPSGEIICGTTWANGGNRDTDWYQLVLTQNSQVILHADAEAALVFGQIAGIDPANPLCASVTGVSPNAIAGICSPVTLDLGTLVQGTHWFFAGLTVFEGFPCDVDYWIEFEIISSCTTPSDPTTSGTATICNGESTNISASSINATTIYWYTGSCGGTEVGTSLPGANFSVSPTTTTTYYARGFNSASGGCWSLGCGSVTITVNQPPTSANAGADQTGASTCGLTQVTLAANIPTVGIGEWSIISGLGGSFVDASSPTSTFNGNAGSTYILRWTISNSPCTASTDDVSVTFNQIPTVDAGSDISICNGSGTQLNGSATIAGAMPSGYCSSTVGNEDETITNVSFNGASQSSGWASYTDYTGSLFTSLTVGNSYTISVSWTSGGNYLEYLKAFIDWDRDGIFESSYLIGSGTSGSTTWSTTIDVPSIVSPGETRMRIKLKYNDDVTDCESEYSYGEVEDYRIELIPLYSYSWSPSTGLSATNIANPVASPNSTQTYTMTATANGCSANDNVTVIVNQPPIDPTGISGATTICSGSSNTLTAEGGSEGSGCTYQWYEGGCGSGSSLGSSSSLIVSPTSTSTYYVRRVGNSPCDGTTTLCASVTVTVNPSPSITGQPSSSGITYGDPASFAVSSLNGTSYQWEEYSTGWAPLSNGGIYSGVNTVTLQLTKPTIAMNGYKYRCIVSGDCTPAATSDGLATLTVAPKSLSVIANSGQFKYETQSDPVFTYIATGFISPDNESVLTGALSRVSGEVEGFYGITIGSLAGANYSISFTPADFEIKAAYVMNITGFLQGSYAGSGLMNTTLRTAGQLPNNQPFNTTPWSYGGTETLPSPLSADVVDWVLVELRSDVNTTLEKKAGLLYKDGSIRVSFSGSSTGGDYVVVWHRNHMPVMSAGKVNLPISGASYNLSASANLYGTNPAINLGDGNHAMIAGDVTHNGVLHYSGPGNDRGAIIAKIAELEGSGATINSVVTGGYWFADVNLNNELRYIGGNDDRSVILTNLGALTGNYQTNSVYYSAVPGFGSKDQGGKDGPFNIQISEYNQNISFEIITNEPVVNGIVDNIQFTLAWKAGDTEIAELLNSFASDFMLVPQGETIEMNGVMHRVYVSVTPVELPEIFNEGDVVTVLSFENNTGQSLTGRLWIADNDFTTENNAMYYVSVWGNDFTGMILGPATGMEEIPEMESVELYPNPVTKGEVNVAMNLAKAQEVTILVTDMQGKLISTTKIFATAGLSNTTLDLYGLYKGVYFVRISGDNLNTVEKLIVK